MPYFAFGLITLALWVFCLVDVITSDESEIRNLPKIGWVMIILFLPTVGSIIWLVAGRPQRAPGYHAAPRGRFPEYERPGRHVAADPVDDAEFLRRCRERAQRQREAGRRYEPRQDEES